MSKVKWIQIALPKRLFPIIGAFLATNLSQPDQPNHYLWLCLGEARPGEDGTRASGRVARDGPFGQARGPD